MKIRSILLLIGFYFSSCEIFDLRIINNPSYSIGVVKIYSPGGRASATVTFQYDVKGNSFRKSYENASYRWNVPSNGVDIGNEFMVQYDSLDPGTARMLFSYQLKDSTDYKKYVALFKKSPPVYPTP
jgi:hypothetical protein